MSENRSLFAELRRRSVYKVAVAYIVAGWALSQGIAQVLPVFNIPNWMIRAFVVLIILGLPVALALAWTFDFTPEGIKRTAAIDEISSSPRPKNHLWLYVVIIGAFLSIGLFFLGRYSARESFGFALGQKSIAVLPFENISAEKENEYFADGVQDDILTASSKVADLRDISRTSVMSYSAGTQRNLREIAQALGVSHVLEGSVRRSDGKVRVSAQLIDARNDTHVWADTYDRDLSDVFATESNIAKTIVEQLRAKLSASEKAAIEEPPTSDVTAHDLYVRRNCSTNRRRLVRADWRSWSKQLVCSIKPSREIPTFFSLTVCLAIRTALFTFTGRITRLRGRRWRRLRSMPLLGCARTPAKHTSPELTCSTAAIWTMIGLAPNSRWHNARCQTMRRSSR